MKKRSRNAWCPCSPLYQNPIMAQYCIYSSTWSCKYYYSCSHLNFDDLIRVYIFYKSNFESASIEIKTAEFSCKEVEIFFSHAFIFMFVFVCRVSQSQHVNKMSLQNLATVYGPTLLRPAASQVEMTPIQMLTAGARDAMLQMEILLYFLTLAESGYDLTLKVSSF